MHRLTTSFVLGYHGCDAVVAEALLAGEPFKPSTNDYDWLGEGVYFWEANPQRGLDFADEVRRRQPTQVFRPAVVGAVIDLGFCLDCATHVGLEQLRSGYDDLIEAALVEGKSVPLNANRWNRRLDRAVVQQVHSIMESTGNPLDTVRGIFIEGDELYPSAGFNTKTHVQIAVRNLACIKGVFRVPARELKMPRAPRRRSQST